MSDSKANRPHDPRGKERFNEERAAYTVASAQPDLEAGVKAIRETVKTLPPRPGVYRMLDAREVNTGYLFISHDLDVIRFVSDRILVMCDGVIIGEVAASEANERVLGLMMAGVDPNEAKAAEGQA